MFRVVVSPRAWHDFFEVFEYIDRDNPSAASEFGHALLTQIELLASFPHIGAPVPRRNGIRKVLTTPIRIYYRIDYESNIVEILHFWHAARPDPDEW